MSRRPFIGRKTARQTWMLGLLGMCLAVAIPARAGCVFVPLSADGSGATQSIQIDGGILNATAAEQQENLLPSGWAVAPLTEGSAGDPCVTFARQSQMLGETKIAPPTLDVAPPDPFDYSSLSTTRHVNSIPVLPAVWSGFTGLGGLWATAAIRRLRRSLR